MMTKPKPLGLVVFLENVGHIHGIKLPQWAMDVVDYCTEEYAKLLLRLYGAYRRYDRIIILEDEQANGPELASTLLATSHSHTLDLLLLVHGHEGRLVGYKGNESVGSEFFKRLLHAYEIDSSALDLRMVYGVNCYGASLAPVWLRLGATVVNGAAGVNWFPEPSLSVFLRNWLAGRPYSVAVVRSFTTARRWAAQLLPSHAGGRAHPAIASSQQIVFGRHDITIDIR